MGQKYEVLNDTLFRIDHSAGFRADETPKKIVEHHKGDVIEFEDNEVNKDRVQELLAAGAIAEAKEDKPEPQKVAAPTAKASGAEDLACRSEGKPIGTLNFNHGLLFGSRCPKCASGPRGPYAYTHCCGFERHGHSGCG